MDPYTRVRAEISLDALTHNFKEIEHNLKEGTKILAVVKADAYGHGAVPVSRHLEGLESIWGFAVATPEEAMELKSAGIQKPVLILGIVFPQNFEELIRHEVRLAVSDLSFALALNDAARRCGRKAFVHLALDTGMTRIGFRHTEDCLDEIEKISRLPEIYIEGAFTHFARADEEDRSPALVQLSVYQDILSDLEKRGISVPMRHTANSAGIIRVPEAQTELVRSGIINYGVYPSEEVERDVVRLRPVMSIKSHVTFVKAVPAGVQISYGGTYTTSEERMIATIPVGYADGYPRGLSNKGHVLIHGRKAPICGRVCMDQFMVDVTDIMPVACGDEVTLLGKDGTEEITADDLGNLSERFSYELLCCISQRVPRVYI